MSIRLAYGGWHIECDTAEEALSLIGPRSVAAPPVFIEKSDLETRVRRHKAAKPIVDAPKEKQDKGPTIRQRIVNMMANGPVTSDTVVRTLRRQGIDTDEILSKQHLYLMTRDSLAEKNEDASPVEWYLTEAGKGKLNGAARSA